MEREYLWWHHGQAFVVAFACLIVGSLAAGASLFFTRVASIGTIAESFIVLALVPLPFAVDRHVIRKRRQGRSNAR